MQLPGLSLMMKGMTPEARSDLFDSLGVELLACNRYRPESLSRADVRRTVYYLRNRAEFEALADRYGGALERRGASPDILPRLEARHIGGRLGYGLFTLDEISEGDLIGEYTGIIRPARPGKALTGGGYSSDYAWGFPRVRSLGRPLEIDARESGGLLRFANHRENPPAEPEHFAMSGRWRIVFVARRRIEAGEEITVDYGEAYWSGSEREPAET